MVLGRTTRLDRVAASGAVPNAIAVAVGRDANEAVGVRTQVAEVREDCARAGLGLRRVVTHVPGRAKVAHFPTRGEVGADTPLVVVLAELADGVAAFVEVQRLADRRLQLEVLAVPAVAVDVHQALGQVAGVPGEAELAPRGFRQAVADGQVVAFNLLAADVDGSVQQRVDAAARNTGVQTTGRTGAAGIHALLDDGLAADGG